MQSLIVTENCGAQKEKNGWESSSPYKTSLKWASCSCPTPFSWLLFRGDGEHKLPATLGTIHPHILWVTKLGIDDKLCLSKACPVPG